MPQASRIEVLSRQSKTEKLRFGCGFNVLPIWHPIRLAEDYAMADILTKGRVRLGVGRGYHSRELECLGPPLYSQADARELFEEQVTVLLKALREPSFAHSGRFYQLPPKDHEYRGYTLETLILVPKPKYSTECWQPIVSATAARGRETELGTDLIFGFSFISPIAKPKRRQRAFPSSRSTRRCSPRSALPERSAMTSYSD